MSLTFDNILKFSKDLGIKQIAIEWGSVFTPDNLCFLYHVFKHGSD